MGILNIPLSELKVQIDKISKDIEELNNTINKLHLVDICTTPQVDF